MAFENSVFINCPFDDEYVPMVRALVFTIIYLDLDPKLSRTESSAYVRVSQIMNLIKNSKYGIHDLSRNVVMVAGQLPRFNMPYELGLDVGAAEFGTPKLKLKKILILDSERYRYHQYISDIGGQDIKDHGNDPERLMLKVREWISDNSVVSPPPKSQIWKAFIQFRIDLVDRLAVDHTPNEIQEMTIGDYIRYVKDWIPEFKNRV